MSSRLEKHQQETGCKPGNHAQGCYCSVLRDKQEAFSRGFDAGNYGNAYESQDWETWYAEHCDAIPAPHRDEYQTGMLLGFFSSYELHEIPDDMTAEEVARLRSLYPEGNI